MPTADELLGREVVARLIATLESSVPSFKPVALRKCARKFGELGLRERSDLVKEALLADLPGDYAHLEQAFRAASNSEDFTGWLIWPVTEAIVERALEEGGSAAFDSAMALLAELTPRLTSELSIRRLLEADLDRAIPIVLSWTDHPDEHVRRLASEGTRPHLPWAKKVKAILAQPESTVPVLDALYRDDSEYVRRSVANHLNDLSRQNPELTVEIARRWLDEPDDNTVKIVRHGLRTLIKKADPGALSLMGFAPAPQVTVAGPVLAATEVVMGDELNFAVTLENTGAEPVRLAVDYLIHHKKANGGQTPKVFKLSVKTIAPKEVITFSRGHSFKRITTRVYYPGEHAIELQVNGTTYGKTSFHLIE
jgi:3-methyladenine DNA glycosylase AlkC